MTVGSVRIDPAEWLNRRAQPQLPAILRSPTLALATRLLAATCLLLGLLSCAVAFAVAPHGYVGWDRDVLMNATSQWWNGASPYPSFQLTAAFTAGGPQVEPYLPTFLYPPVALPLFAPFVVLPTVIWWALPLGTIAAIVWAYRPAPWGIFLIGVCLLQSGTWTLLVWGNATMLITALLALGLRQQMIGPLVLIKPTLLPFAVLGALRRSWWYGLIALGLVALLFGPGLWGEWVTSIRNARNEPLTYSLYQVPFVMIPVIAQLSGRGQMKFRIAQRRGSTA